MAKKREDVDFGGLNLLPIMNMVCLLIPFLLMAAQFIQIGVIMVETPRLSHVKSQPDEQKKEALNLTLVVTDKGFYVKSRHGSECPEGVSDDEKLCFRKKEGKFSEAMIKALHHHLWFLHASKYKSEESYAAPEEKYAITIIPEPTVKYEDLVKIMDVVRDIPADARNPPVKHSVPASGCKMEFDRKTASWGFRASGTATVKEAACMYYRITLALGSS
jgi:biopolymer transport protein ExbD